MLSVIIPVRNGEEMLGNQLDALKKQMYDGEWEIIIVNNCSDDNTPVLVQQYQHTMPNLRLVDAPQKPNKAYARNVGAQAAKGDVFLFCDSDDVVGSNWLAALAEGLENHDFVTGKLEMETLNQNLDWRRPHQSNGAVKPVLGFLPTAFSCNLGVSRCAFEKIQGFSEVFYSGQDIDLSWRLQLQGYKLHFIPSAVVHYRYRNSFGDMWRQLVGYASSHVLLYKHFASQGMPRSPFPMVRGRYLRLIKGTRHLFGGYRSSKEKWIYDAALSWGRLRGSIRHRTLYL